jgi:peptidoglycan pentaglycine glycine transferase (the first glycine)
MAISVASPSDAEWNDSLATLPKAHVLQSWEWGDFKSQYGWQPTRRLWMDGEKARAATSILTRQAARGLASVTYVPKGPALDYADEPLVARVLADLEGAARRARSLFVKIDPDIEINTAEGAAATSILRRRGWHPSSEEIQFRNTVCIDLTRSDDEMLAAMKPKCRYNIRLASRKGVVVRLGSHADLGLLYHMYSETAARDGFVIRPESYYEDAWGGFVQAGLAQPLIAEVEGEPVAMVIVYCFAQRAWYMYGASRTIHRDKMPNHLLQWAAMQWAKEQGCTIYDMWGAPNQMVESDPLWGVYRFKQGFGGELVEHIGAWDFPVSRLGYWVYTVMMPRVLAAMRRRYWRREG